MSMKRRAFIKRLGAASVVIGSTLGCVELGKLDPPEITVPERKNKPDLGDWYNEEMRQAWIKHREKVAEAFLKGRP